MAWALEQSKFFTQGCDRLTVATDHKPLISLLGQKSLDQVPNTRLFRIKQRISSWKFRITHCPGKANFFADASSRRPVQEEDDTEQRFVDANLASVAVTIAEAAKAAKEDKGYWALHQALVAGTPLVAAACKEYLQYRDRMYPHNRVLLFEDQIIIPSGLRPKVLTILHAAHQGKSTMLQNLERISVELTLVKKDCPFV